MFGETNNFNNAINEYQDQSPQITDPAFKLHDELACLEGEVWGELCEEVDHSLCEPDEAEEEIATFHRFFAA